MSEKVKCECFAGQHLIFLPWQRVHSLASEGKEERKAMFVKVNTSLPNCKLNMEIVNQFGFSETYTGKQLLTAISKV